MAQVKRYNPTVKPARHQRKGILLYLFLFPLFLSILGALSRTDIKAFGLNLISFLLFFIVLHLSKKGFSQEAQYLQNKLTRAPKTPYKMIAGYLLGGATFFASFVAGNTSLVKSLFLAVLAIVGYYLYYGFDPKKDKLANIDDISADFVLDEISEAREKIASIQSHMEQIGGGVLRGKLEKAIEKADGIIDMLQENPQNVRVTRKFLIVYIDGIAEVLKRYTQLKEETIELQTREKMLSLVDALDAKFDEELEKLRRGDHFDLDVNIDALHTQIKS